MSKSSPTVARIVAILNFFLEHPQQAFTFTQVVKSLDLSRATAHSILLGFVDTGYLYRRADKSYVLGPVLPSLAGNANISPLTVASQELRKLADELKVVASATFREGDELVVRERAFSANHLGLPQLKANRSFPFLPWGSVFLISSSDEVLQQEFANIKPSLDEGTLAEVFTEIDFCRLHGFITMLARGHENDISDFMKRGYAIAEIDLQKSYNLRSLIAPVMGENSEVVFAISLFGFERPMVGSELMRVGQQLRDTCDRINNFIVGNQLSVWKAPLASRVHS